MTKKKTKILKTYLKLKKRDCPACNSNQKKKILEIDHWMKMDSRGKVYVIDKKYCICQNCDLIYTNPTANPKAFDKLYQNSVVGSFFNYESSKNTKKIKMFEKISKNYLNKNNKVLEIGSGGGILLKHLFSKYKFKKKNLTGLEPSKSIFKKLINNKYFTIKNIFLNNLKSKNKYNFVIMDNVFEHFEYPQFSLKKINQILLTKGLVYISIPDSEKIHGSQNDPFNHTCNYNESNIRSLLNNFGFKIIKLSKESNLINLLALKDDNLKREKFVTSNVFRKKLNKKMSLINKRVYIIRKKAEKIKEEINKNKEKVVIFGSGNYSLWILNMLNINKYVEFGFDNNEIYQDKIRNNILILNPSKIKKINFDKILILSHSFKNDIFQQLLKMNIPKKKIILF